MANMSLSTRIAVLLIKLKIGIKIHNPTALKRIEYNDNEHFTSLGKKCILITIILLSNFFCRFVA